MLLAITAQLICGNADLKITTSCYKFSLSYWNLNSITVLKFSKISLFEAYIVQYKFDVICISEKYLDPDVISDITQSNNPTNTRKGGVSGYLK